MTKPVTALWRTVGPRIFPWVPMSAHVEDRYPCAELCTAPGAPAWIPGPVPSPAVPAAREVAAGQCWGRRSG